MNIIGIWKPSVTAALAFVKEFGLERNFVQIAPSGVSDEFWMLLRVTAGEEQAIRSLPVKPSLTVIP